MADVRWTREEVITAQEVRLEQQGDNDHRRHDDPWHIESTTVATMWRGELRLWDNEILMGWYAADDGSVRSKGTMYFVLHPHGVSSWTAAGSA